MSCVTKIFSLALLGFMPSIGNGYVNGNTKENLQFTFRNLVQNDASAEATRSLSLFGLQLVPITTPAPRKSNKHDDDVYHHHGHNSGQHKYRPHRNHHTKSKKKYYNPHQQYDPDQHYNSHHVQEYQPHSPPYYHPPTTPMYSYHHPQPHPHYEYRPTNYYHPEQSCFCENNLSTRKRRIRLREDYETELVSEGNKFTKSKKHKYKKRNER